MELEMTASTLGADKGKQSKQRAQFTKILGRWQPPQPASRSPPLSLPDPQSQGCSTHQCLGCGQAPTQLLPELPCEVVPRKAFLGKSICFQTEFAHHRGMAFLSPLPGVTLCLPSPRSFGGVQSLQLGRCLAEDRSRCKDLSPTISEELVSRTS